ncbi:unnamed protein product [marine sediment metagenome]|uniref:Uncharacterized protein n=1 Tax=marine sediment metagenome TaxID=412755 RepID=X0UXB0_9ZZZZ
MKDEQITFETAVLAKEKGFNEEADCYYMISDKGSILLGVRRDDYEPNKMVTNDEGVNVAVVVTQSLLQRWLREEHFIDVFVIDSIKENHYDWEIKLEDYKAKLECDQYYLHYELALEAGLKKALTIIK